MKAIRVPKSKITSEIAVKILKQYIKRHLKSYDKQAIYEVRHSPFFKLLTNDNQVDIIDLADEADSEVSRLLLDGEITPMMLSERNKTRGAYIYYLRYLRDVVLKENPSEAKRLAYEVQEDILFNEYIDDKEYFDKDYLNQLLHQGETRRQKANRRNQLKKKAFFNRAEVKEAERIHCDKCFEQVVFSLRDNEHEFSLGMTTVIECLAFAIRNGDLPKLPRSWCIAVENALCHALTFDEELTYYDYDKFSKKKDSVEV